jgi:hypothetical protein
MKGIVSTISFPVALGNIQRDRLCRTQPLVTRRSICPGKRFRDLASGFGFNSGLNVG